MKEIQINKQVGIKMIALVDDEDFDRINSFNWSANKGIKNKTYYAFRTVKLPDKQIRILMHRFIMNPPAGFIVDHINHDTLDNRKENLRIGTQSRNMLNRHGAEDSSSKYKGVSLFKKNKQWLASYKGKHIGYFDKEEDAAIAYNAVAYKADPSWTLLNMIKGYTNDQLITMPASYHPYVKKNKYRGVRYRSANCYEAYIQHKKNQYTIGTYPTEREAVQAFNDECDKLGLINKKNVLPVN